MKQADNTFQEYQSPEAQVRIIRIREHLLQMSYNQIQAAEYDEDEFDM